jgi:hypothetical protein
MAANVNVYVAGAENRKPKYWTNGSRVILGDILKKSEAYPIFLVKKQAAMCKIFY